MIGQSHVRRFFVASSFKKVIALIKSVARDYGFEITERNDIDPFAHQQTGPHLSRKILLIQMHDHVMTLSGALLDYIAPKIVPLRVIVWEMRDNKSMVYFPDWNINDEAENTQAQSCNNEAYREALTGVVLALKSSLNCTIQPGHAVKQPVQ